MAEICTCTSRKQVTTSFTVPARVTVVKIVGYSGEQQREYTAYVKVTPGKTYKVSCGDQYDVSLNDNGDEDIWWQDYMISIGKFQMGDIWGGNYSVIDDEVTISW